VVEATKAPPANLIIVMADRKIPSGKIDPTKAHKAFKVMASGPLLNPQWIFPFPKMLSAFKVFSRFTPEVMAFFVTLPKIMFHKPLTPLLLPHLSKG
jgi:hypothetical protein